MPKPFFENKSVPLIMVFLGLVVLSWPFLSVAASTPIKDKVQFTWKGSSRSLLDSHKTFLDKNGAVTKPLKKESSGKRFGAVGTAIVILAGASALCVLTQSITQAIVQLESRGLAIDMSGDGIKINERPDTKVGRVLIKKPDGTLVFYERESNTDLCTILTSALSKL